MVKLSPEGEKKLDALVARVVEERKIPGFVFVASSTDEEIYLNSGGYKVVNDPTSGAVTPDTPFWICSQTKLIAHIAALQLIEQDKFTQETPVTDFFPEFANAIVLDDITAQFPTFKPVKTIMRVKHLLNFTSGLFYPVYPIPPVKNTSLPPAYRAAHNKTDPHTEFFKNVKGGLPGIPLKFEPGTNFAYGFSSDVLGFIVEKVTGITLENYCQANIFGPLDMKASFYLTPEVHKKLLPITYRWDGKLEPWADQVALIERDPNEDLLCFGGVGLYTSLRDNLSLLRHLLQIQAGRISKGILSPSTVQQFFVPALPDSGIASLEHFTDQYYQHPGGNQWSTALAVTTYDWPGRRKKGSAFWSGWAGTVYFMDPTTGVAAVFGTQILPGRDLETTKLYKEFEETLYSGLVHDS